MIEYENDSDGVALLRWNAPNHATNLLSLESIEKFGELARRAIGDPDVKGIVVASAKRDFIAGADLTKILPIGTPREQYEERILGLHRLWREIETCGKPVVAAINGTALGGGFELALCCHRRIAADNPAAKIGLPEVGVGLIPGGGGTQRLPRLIGPRAAVPLILQSRTMRVEEAAAAGLVDEVVAPEDLETAARRWVLENAGRTPVQPWDRDGGVDMTGDDARSVLDEAAKLAGTKGLQSAPQHALASIREGAACPIDEALAVEARHFVACCYDPQTVNILRTTFFGVQAARKLAARPKGIPTATFDRIGVLGAGMMGAGIAQVTAASGIGVVMLDETPDKARDGLNSIGKRLERAVARGKFPPARVDETIGRIEATANFATLAGVQLAIEAVYENRDVKADVTRRAIAAMGDDRLFASNTSTLPITSLAAASSRPEGFIGMHFFSPVDQMPLVEIIMGEKTSDTTLAHSLDFIREIRKVPIVVRDSRGFYTSRVFGTYIYEALEMLEEGIAPELIEKSGLASGMPMPPLALSDELSIELAYKVLKQERADFGNAFKENAAYRVCRLMVDRLGRSGRKAGGGYYDYTPDGKKIIWPGLAEHFETRSGQPQMQELVDRFLSIQSVEALRCLDKGVLFRAIDGDIGAVLGWGFPAYRGGPFAYVDTVGVKEFVERCERLSESCGERFSPPELARNMAAEGRRFYSDNPTEF